jgi:CheY-like chemotaxis protein
MTVLLVEDNELNRDMLVRRLARVGIDAVCAADGEEGVNKARDLKPDVVLMDINLPVIDGWEAIRRLRDMPETATIPIIALTAHVFPEDRERAAAVGCSAFVAKPVEMAKLIEAIRQLTGGGAA